MSDFYNKYPYTDFHELNLDWVIERVKKLTEDWLATIEEWHNTQEEWQQLHDYVMNYFANLDVQDEINNKINAMIADGTFLSIVAPTITQTVIDTTTDWLTVHITQPTTPVVDTSLAIAGAAADSKTVGDTFKRLRFVTPQMYGAHADGVTDDTTAIQTAVNTNNIVFIPYGNYLISAPIQINSNNKIISNKASLLCSNGIGLEGDTVVNFSIEGLIFKNSYNAIKLVNCSYFSIDNINVYDSASYGFYFEGIRFFNINNVVINNNTSTSTNDGIHFNAGCYDGVVTGVSCNTGDDFIALNAAEKYSPLSNVGIGRITFNNCRSISEVYCGIRFYSTGDEISYITFNDCRFVGTNNPDKTPLLRFTNDVSTAGTSQNPRSNVKNAVFNRCVFDSKVDAEDISLTYTNITDIEFNECSLIRHAYTSADNFINCRANVSIRKITFNSVSLNDQTGASPSPLRFMYLATNSNITRFNLTNTVFENSSNNAMIYVNGYIRTFGGSHLTMDNIKTLLYVTTGGQVSAPTFDDVTMINSNRVLQLNNGTATFICLSNITYNSNTYAVDILSPQTLCIISGHNIMTPALIANVYINPNISLTGIRIKSGIISNVEPVSMAAGDSYITTAGVHKISDGNSWKAIALA